MTFGLSCKVSGRDKATCRKSHLFITPNLTRLAVPRGTGGPRHSGITHECDTWLGPPTTFSSDPHQCSATPRPDQGRGTLMPRAEGRTGQTGRLSWLVVMTCIVFHKKVLSRCCLCCSVVSIFRAQFSRLTLLLEDGGFTAPPPGCALGGHRQAPGGRVAPVSGLRVLSLQTSLRPWSGEESVSLRTALPSDLPAVPSFSSDPWGQLLLGH